MSRHKIFRLFWVFLLVISAFTLGYTIKPTTSERPRTFAPMSTGRGIAPPLNFGDRR
jgi:hypothetical protein